MPIILKSGSGSSVSPASSFTSQIDVADYPALAVHWDSEDFVSVSATRQLLDPAYWVDRVAGVQIRLSPISSNYATKDAEGVYSLGTTLSVIGTLPLVTSAHTVVSMMIGKPLATASAGPALSFGAQESGPSYSPGGLAYQAEVAVNTAVVLDATPMTTLGVNTCHASSFDCTSATFGRINRCLANSNVNDAVHIGSSQNYGTDTGIRLPVGQLSGISAASLTTGSTYARYRHMLLWLFTTPLSYQELRSATIESARTRQPPVAWRNKL